MSQEDGADHPSDEAFLKLVLAGMGMTTMHHDWVSPGNNNEIVVQEQQQQQSQQPNAQQQEEEDDNVMNHESECNKKALRLVASSGVAAAVILFAMLQAAAFVWQHYYYSMEIENGEEDLLVVNVTAAARAAGFFVAIQQEQSFGRQFSGAVAKMMANAIGRKNHHHVRKRATNPLLLHVIYAEEEQHSAKKCRRSGSKRRSEEAVSRIMKMLSWEKNDNSKKLSILAPLADPSTMEAFLASHNVQDSDAWNLQEFRKALHGACDSILSQKQQATTIQEIVVVDDVLVPSRLCRLANASSLTLGGIVRLAELVQDSWEGNLPLVDYSSVFEKSLPEETWRLFVIVISDSNEDEAILKLKRWTAAMFSEVVGTTTTKKKVAAVVASKTNSPIPPVPSFLTVVECPPGVCLFIASTSFQKMCTCIWPHVTMM
jgi:hypothetical protein